VKAYIAAAILLLAFPAQAQQTATLLGTWSGTYKGRGSELGVTMIVKETGGTWTFSPIGATGQRNPCVGKSLPVVVKSRTDTELVIEIEGARVLQGCLDATVRLRSGGKTLRGLMEDGRSVTLARP
jgi:hypothetical protein